MRGSLHNAQSYFDETTCQVWYPATQFLVATAMGTGFPLATVCATHRRKKDHGRAEAMLIAAWALGLRILPETDTVRMVPPEEGSKDAAALDELLEDEEEEAE